MQSLEQMKQNGIDVDSAMKRFLNNEQMYREFLKEMIEDPSYENLMQAIQEKQIETAFDEAHRLKGLLGNLSLTGPYEILYDMVETLRTKTLPSKETISLFATEYKACMEYIRQI